MTSTKDFRQFIKDEMVRRDMSARRFAEFMDVSPTTITRAIDEADPSTPGLDFLMKLAAATNVSIATLIELAYPDIANSSRPSPSAQILAQQIETLPDSQREVVLSIIRGTKVET